jgi:hypothetical protein
MTGQGAVDLIPLADDEGNSVAVQVTGRDMPGVLTRHDTLIANVLVTTGFVRGQLKVWLSPRDLVAWETALDSLTAEQDISWMGGRAPEIRIRLEGERDCPDVIVDDIPGSMATVTVPVEGRSQRLSASGEVEAVTGDLFAFADAVRRESLRDVPTEPGTVHPPTRT